MERIDGIGDASQYGLSELHDYYLNMIDDFDAFCRTCGIKYSLSGGTLLGAVRHGGFIPWDDDVDMMFDRENYEKFLSCFNASPMSEYEIIGHTWVLRISRKDNPYKVQEARSIDLFVIDEVPASKLIEKTKILVLRFLQGMMKEETDYKRFSALYRLMLFVTRTCGKFFSISRKQKMYDRVARWGNGKDFVNVYNTTYSQIGTKKFKKDILDSYVLLPFEDKQYMSIAGYDSYLTELYGDYNQLPDVTERVPSHKREEKAK